MAVMIKKYVNNNKQSNAYGKTYGRVAQLGTVEVDELASEIQSECTATRHDVLAVISALGVVVKRKLQESKRVHLPYLGTFKLGVSTKGEEKAENFNMRDNIKGVHVIFQPETTVENGHRVKELIRGVKIRELQKYSGLTGDAAAAIDYTPEPGTGGGDDNQEDPVENRP